MTCNCFVCFAIFRYSGILFVLSLTQLRRLDNGFRFARHIRAVPYEVRRAGSEIALCTNFSLRRQRGRVRGLSTSCSGCTRFEWMHCARRG